MLRENPAQLWANTRQIVLDRLKGENAALLKRLGELEASTIASVSDPDGAGAPAKEASISSTGIPRESWESLKREKEDLEDALKQKEKRLLRLQQVHRALSPSRKFTNCTRILASRCLRRKAQSSVKRSPLFLASSLHFTPMAKSESRRCTTWVHPLSFSLRRTPRQRTPSWARRKCN